MTSTKKKGEDSISVGDSSPFLKETANSKDKGQDIFTFSSKMKGKGSSPGPGGPRPGPGGPRPGPGGPRPTPPPGLALAPGPPPGLALAPPPPPAPAPGQY